MNGAIWNHWTVKVLLFISFLCFDFHLHNSVWIMEIYYHKKLATMLGDIAGRNFIEISW